LNNIISNRNCRAIGTGIGPLHLLKMRIDSFALLAKAQLHIDIAGAGGTPKVGLTLSLNTGAAAAAAAAAAAFHRLTLGATRQNAMAQKPGKS
jgi:hypothetical protein